MSYSTKNITHISTEFPQKNNWKLFVEIRYLNSEYILLNIWCSSESWIENIMPQMRQTATQSSWNKTRPATCSICKPCLIGECIEVTWLAWSDGKTNTICSPKTLRDIPWDKNWFLVDFVEKLRIRLLSLPLCLFPRWNFLQSILLKSGI